MHVKVPVKLRISSFYHVVRFRCPYSNNNEFSLYRMWQSVVLDGITFQKTTNFMFTAVRTTDLTL